MTNGPFLTTRGPWSWHCIVCQTLSHPSGGVVDEWVGFMRALGGPVPLEWFCDTYCGERLMAHP